MTRSKNKLFYGDNLEVLKRHIKDETVDLCYIDPPFNSKRNYNQIYNAIGEEDKAQAQAFVDTWEWNHQAEIDLRSIYEGQGFPQQTIYLIQGLEKVLRKGALLSYLVSMTLRINEIWRVLKPTGSFYLHCDPTASHYLKLVCDSIFCGGQREGEYLNEIVWCYTSGGKSKKHFAKKHDVILYYSKSKEWVFNIDAVRVPYSPKTLANYKPGLKGSSYTAEVKLHEGGKVPEDYWNIAIATKSTKEYLGYPTQKPLALLERIVQASSNEGDVVLDAYCGCGTTVTASQKLNRQWIGIDITYQSVSLILKRLADTYGEEVINTEHLTLSGVPKDLAAAKALANKADDRLRKEFEKWLILTYSNNRAIINEKKGGDGGIDGISRFPKGQGEHGSVIFSVKSDKIVNPSYVRDLAGTVLKENADMGILLCLNEPSKGVKQTASEYGMWTHNWNNQDYPKVLVVSVEDVIQNDLRLDKSLAGVVLKQAVKDDTSKQVSLFDTAELEVESEA
jgi:DNA modification methylase